MKKDAVKKFLVSDFAETFNISARTLRFYEELGLISPERSESGYRKYTEKDAFLLKTVQTLKELGLTLSDIQALLSPSSDKKNKNFSMADLRTSLMTHRKEFVEKAKQFEKNIAHIDKILKALSSCACCGKTHSTKACKSCIDENHIASEEVAPVIRSIVSKKRGK